MLSRVLRRTMSTSTNPHTVIVGNGIAGLNLAYKLVTDSKQPKDSVVVVEKSRATGGRMATRRGDDGAVYDHGAQYYKGDRKEMQALHKVWSHAQLVHRWMQSESKSGKPAEDMHCASQAGGMSSLAKHLAKDVDVKLQHELKTVKRANDSWELHFADQSTMTAKQLVITAPLPQALQILRNSDIKYDTKLDKVTYAKALCGLYNVPADSSNSIKIGDTGNNILDTDGIHSITDQKAKGVSAVQTIVVVMSPEFSDSNYADAQKEGEAAEAVLQKITDATRLHYPDFKPAKSQLKRWMYSHSESTPGEMYSVVSESPLLLLIGDGFGGGSIGGSVRSSNAAYDYLSKQSTQQSSAL